MLLKILRFLIGYLKVEVNGFAPERFMNLIISNDIVVWDVVTTEKGYIFFTGRKNLLKMKPFLQKTNVKISILEKHGLPYIIKKSKKRMFFLCGFLLCGVYIFIMSLFVWEVKVVGEDRLVAKEILKHIEKEYIPLGTRIKDVDCNKLEEKLRKDYEEISWISCNLKGTTLTVSLEEGISVDENEENQKACDIVASKDATIVKMITREGTPVEKVKNEVSKGDILISGTIYIYDDNEEVLETNYIAADGDVIGQTQFQYADSIDEVYYEKQYEKKSKHYITFFLFDYCLTPLKPSIPEKNIDVNTQIHKARIFSDFYLPFGYKITEIKKYSICKKTYKTEEMKKILQERLNKKKKEFEAKGVEIIENNVKIEKTQGKMTAKGTMVLNEPIGISRDLSVVPDSGTENEE